MALLLLLLPHPLADTEEMVAAVVGVASTETSSSGRRGAGAPEAEEDGVTGMCRKWEEGEEEGGEEEGAGARVVGVRGEGRVGAGGGSGDEEAGGGGAGVEISVATRRGCWDRRGRVQAGVTVGHAGLSHQLRGAR